MDNLKDLLPYFQNKPVEIYVGDQFEEVQMSDHSHQIKSVIYGFIKDVVSDFVVVDSFYDLGDGTVRTGNILFISGWQIVAITQLDGFGSLKDVFMSIKDSSKVKKILNIKDR